MSLSAHVVSPQRGSAGQEAPMADAVAVANRLLALARERGDTLSPMQVLKLTYIAHGWMLGLYGRPLFLDEVQAWQYGPVIPRLYRLMRQYKSKPVSQDLPGGGPLDRHENHIVEQVYERYGSMTGPALSRITHAPGTPWALTYRPGSFGLEISNDLIEDHYAQLARERATPAA